MKHNDPTLQVLTSKAQADKAINSLKGILMGITSDSVVNHYEITELRQWAAAHNQLIGRNPFNEFMTIINQYTSAQLPTRETIDDLYWLCQKYETDNYYYNAVTADLQTLQGICHGILSDGNINDSEIHGLKDWLRNNEHLNTHYPYDELRSLILSIVSDGVITDDERLVLKAYFNTFVRIQNTTVSEQIKQDTNNVPISALCTSEPSVTFEQKTFCITGITKRYSRDDYYTQIRKLGGLTTDSITLKTDYLIVGDSGNPAWAFSCYGRKVEKALDLRKKGHTITIIHEFDFADIVDDLS